MGIVTISRGSHSGGKAVAEQLGRRLDYPVLGREQLLLQTAEEYGISEKVLADALNQSPPAWQQVLGKRLVYVKCVTVMLFKHVRQGNLIYHGNVGHLLLAGISHAMRVRVIADMEQRIRAAMEQNKLDRKQAAAHIQNADKERGKWTKALYGVNWDEVGQYDVILNLERITVAGACETLARMLDLENFRPTEASRKALDDAILGCRVWAAMAKNPSTRSASLEVTADGGDVRIVGNVGSSKTIETIAETARQVEGVINLRCEVGMGTDWYW
ncbi:MAG: cytidylate kinase family protein [Pirellulales bacterium]|nr:cytidylate kinase family protein [Pirellulales bacterium]